MAQQTINVGSAIEDGTGDPVRVAFTKCNANFTELYTADTAFLTTTVAATTYQPLDADLTAIAALTGTNTIYYRSAANTWSPVVISTGLAFSGGNLTCTVSTAGSQPLDATLTALAAYNTNGLLTQTAADTFTGRTLTGPAAGITVSNGNGVAGNPTLALADDLAALEALSGTDTIYYRSGTSAWTAVTIGTGLTFTSGTLAATGGGGGGDAVLAANQTFTGANTFNGVPTKIKGVTDGSNAAAGYIGEYMQSTQTSAAAVSCVSGAATNFIISPVTLTAGDWVIMMAIHFLGTSNTDACYVQASLGLTSSTWNSTLGFHGQNGTWPRSSGVSLSVTVGPTRVSLTGSQNYYGLAYTEFSGTGTQTMKAFGIIQAWRIR